MKFSLLLLFVFVLSCQESSNDTGKSNRNASFDNKLASLKNNSSNSDLKKNEQLVKLNELKLIHNLKDDSLFLGNVYVDAINDSIFSSMYIINPNNEFIDTLYIVTKGKFLNKNGLDIKANPKGFWGYQVSSKGKDYITIFLRGNYGKNISDNAIIKWNKSSRVFEVLKF